MTPRLSMLRRMLRRECEMSCAVSAPSLLRPARAREHMAGMVQLSVGALTAQALQVQRA